MNPMASFLQNPAGVLAEAVVRLVVRSEPAPIATVEAACEFARTRAAFVAQKKLYGYLKERIGTRYPKMFADDRFVASINLAKLEVFAACLADLTCFCVANAMPGATSTNTERAAMARACYAAGIEANTLREAAPETRDSWLAAFERRLEATVWQATGAREHFFSESASALLRWAPVAAELKRFDAEIVRNSVRYAWIEVRRDYLKRVDPAAIAADWRKRAGRAQAPAIR